MVKLSVLFAGLVTIFLFVDEALSIRLDLDNCRRCSSTRESVDVDFYVRRVKVRCRGIKPFNVADCRGTCINIRGKTVQLRPVWQSVELRAYGYFRKMFDIPVSCYCPVNGLAKITC